MLPPLTISSLLELTTLFEHSSVFTDHQGQHLKGVPRGRLKHSALSAAELADWSAIVGYTNTVAVRCEDRTLLLAIEHDQASNGWFYRSPETYRKCAVALDDLAIIAISAAKLLHYLADLLAIPMALRTGIQSPAIPEVLWHLGKTRVQGMGIDIWCARHLTTQATLVIQHLKRRILPDTGLVLTFGPDLPEIVAPPRQYRWVALRQVLSQRGQGCGIDEDRLYRLLAHADFPDSASAHPVRFDSYSNTLVITTKSIAPWAIKGARQQAVVRYLVEQLFKDRRWIPSHEILSYVYGAQQQSHSRRISDIFRGNQLWKDYITTS
ncbi:MAG TPA: hypothetical protein PKC70_08645, partial [Cellvibrionaceae bacterium]|nr:hypothetical protein [Cellvibrionaceae bacterium]